MIRSTALLAITAITLMGCTLGSGVSSQEERPEGAKAGTCWAKQIKPAVIQTSTTQSMIAGQDGETIYQTETSQSIIEAHDQLMIERVARYIKESIKERFIEGMRPQHKKSTFKKKKKDNKDNKGKKKTGIKKKTR